MCDSDIKKQFEDYRESLHTELQNLHSIITIIKQLEDPSNSEFIRCAPSFYNYSRFSLGVTVVIWASKLFTQTKDNREINALKYMRFAESNYKLLFGTPYYSERLKESWPVSKTQLSEHLIEAQGLVEFPELVNIRDKYYAHFDKQHFFDQSTLFESNQVTLTEIDRRTTRFHEILMKYSTAYDGQFFALKIHNINDFEHLMWLINKHKANQQVEPT